MSEIVVVGLEDLRRMNREGIRSALAANASSAAGSALTVPQVAKRLGLDRSKVYEMIFNGELPVLRFGRSVRVLDSALERWLEERTR